MEKIKVVRVLTIKLPLCLEPTEDEIRTLDARLREQAGNWLRNLDRCESWYDKQVSLSAGEGSASACTGPPGPRPRQPGSLLLGLCETETAP